MKRTDVNKFMYVLIYIFVGAVNFYVAFKTFQEYLKTEEVVPVDGDV